ncbi:hypothetical protein M8J77_018673 [Diaphorina citri]|nr:hypothetical protein M8J77_018673 [Diaphorina citri]
MFNILSFRLTKLFSVTLLESVLICSQVRSSVSHTMSSTDSAVNTSNVKTANDTFLYFAYGSNLNSKRIHVNNPSAKRKGVGLLKDYRLDFGRFSERWKGAVATVVPDKGEEVWGAIWEIDSKDMDNLDNQEGVHINWYQVIEPDVLMDNQTVKCRSYHLCGNPEKQTPLPEARYPSQLYHEVIVQGAVETGLPKEYLEKLKAIPHRDPVPNAAIPEDKVEGVERNIYQVFHPLISSTNETLVCRCYKLTQLDPAGTDIRPSVTYLNLVLEGAVESGLPEDYIARMKFIESNGESVEYTTDRKVYL